MFHADSNIDVTRIGFTGSRHGMTPEQVLTVQKLITFNRPDEAHHGDCVGSDAQFHDTVREHAPGCSIIIHPPVNPAMRAFRTGDKHLELSEYWTRNRNIVAASSMLIAAPISTVAHFRYGGTWSTVEYAVQRGFRVRIVGPDGRLHGEGRSNARRDS